MDLVVVGNVSRDTVEINNKQVETIGGAAYYVALAASLTGCTTFLVALAGSDFPIESIPNIRQLRLNYLKIVDGPTTHFKLRYDHTMVLKEITSKFGPRPIEPKDMIPLPSGTNAFHVTSKEPISPERFLTISNASFFSTDVSLSSLEKKRTSIKSFIPHVRYLFMNADEYNLSRNWLNFKEYSQLTLIVTSGENGLQVFRKDNIICEVPAYKTQIVDPTGAGDVLAGGTLGMLCQNRELETALSVGSAMGSICVENWGPSRIANASIVEIHDRAAWILSKVKHHAK